MKKTLSAIGIALFAAMTANAQNAAESAEYYNIVAGSISDNGNWMTGEIGEGGLQIINIATGQTWTYEGGSTYESAHTRAVADDGTVVGEVNNIPSYWTPGTDGKGKWTNLKGYVNTGGYFYASVGAVTPDGSMIVGAIAKGGGDMMDEEDVQWDYPCVWHRNSDGTYGEPEFLPNTGKDIFGREPQYVHCLAVSQDGKTIAGMMRSGSGFFHFPLLYTLQDNGEWELKYLGMDLVNPRGIEPNPYPGEFNEEMPNYEPYMSGSELNEFYAYFDNRIPELEREGYTEDDIMVQERIEAALFMSGNNQTEYEALLNSWLTAYSTWEKAWSAYEKTTLEIMNTGYDFEFNNILISPDGKYLYSSAKKQMEETFTPVAIDAETDNHTLYPNELNLLISSIGADYSILCHPYDKDTDMYRMAYIFPEGQTTPVAMIDYLKERVTTEVYAWMEEHMYQSVIVSLTSTGTEVYGDEWVFGKPVCTPDMELIAFGGSTLYWESAPYDCGYITFLLNTGLDVTPGENAVESIEAASTGETVYYNLQGTRVSHPDHGIFVKIENGKATKILR